MRTNGLSPRLNGPNSILEEEIIKLLGLDSVKLPVRLHYFLHDPANGLARFLFNPLFDLLKAKTNVDLFKQILANVADPQSASFSIER